jgi:hypothetical protein
MTNDKKDAGLTLPLQVAPAFFHYDYRRILSEACVPLGTAVGGDVVAICLDSDITTSGFHTGKVRNIVVKEADGESGYDMSFFSAQTEERQRDMAYACMAIQNNAIVDEELIAGHIANMPDGSDRTAGMGLVLMPDAAFLYETSLYMKLFTSSDRGALQSIVNNGLLALLPRHPASAHEILEMKPQLDLLLDLANTFWSIGGPTFGQPHTPLSLPRLDGLMGDGLARDPQ